MERAIRRKFELYDELRELLLGTGEEELAEAAPPTSTGAWAATAPARIGSAICLCVFVPSFASYNESFPRRRPVEPGDDVSFRCVV